MGSAGRFGRRAWWHLLVGAVLTTGMVLAVLRWRASGVPIPAAPVLAGLAGCLDAATGRSLWEVNVLRHFKGQGAGFGYACTPLVEDGKVILPVGGPGASLVALDAADGSTVWQAGDDPGSYTPALPITIAGRRWVVAFLRNSLIAVDLKTGEPRWHEEVSTHYDEHA